MIRFFFPLGKSLKAQALSVFYLVNTLLNNPLTGGVTESKNTKLELVVF